MRRRDIHPLYVGLSTSEIALDSAPIPTARGRGASRPETIIQSEAEKAGSHSALEGRRRTS